MSLTIELPAADTIELTDLVLDVNGTLTDRGDLIDGVRPRLRRLSADCAIHLVSADTFGTLTSLAESLAVPAVRVATGEHKLDVVDELGRDRCGVIGNGANDALALEAAVLGIAVIGPEGASADALRAADLVCPSIAHALDLLLQPRTLAATLRP